MAEPYLTFFDAERPASGGWHYYGNPDDRNTFIHSHGGPDSVIAEVVKYRANNGIPHTVDSVMREAWAYWCGREPGRCSNVQAGSVPVAYGGQKVISKEFAGNIIWKFLNLAAAQFDDIGRTQFLTIVETVAPMLTCPTCKAHWQRILTEQPTNNINSCRAACQWVHGVHEAVNRTIGKGSYSYQQGVVDYGFPPLL